MAGTLLKNRFSSLEVQMAAVEATRRYDNSEYFSGDRIDNELFLRWRLNAQNLLTLIGPTSPHLKQFVEFQRVSAFRTPAIEFGDLKAVFLAAKDDFEGGLMTTLRNIVAAELFSTELDQATELFAHSYITAAAVIAGVVLETTLRELCNDNGVPVGKLGRMNEDLAKAGVYTNITKNRLVGFIGIRNSAAHGKTSEFTSNNVEDMIDGIGKFISDQVS